jgi:hypothetical protein
MAFPQGRNVAQFESFGEVYRCGAEREAGFSAAVEKMPMSLAA